MIKMFDGCSDELKDDIKEIYPNIINISGNDTNNGYYDNEHCILATNIQSALNDDI